MSIRLIEPRRQLQPRLDFDGLNYILTAPPYNREAIGDLAAGSFDKKRNVYVLPGYLIYARTVLEMFPDIEISPVVQARLSGVQSEMIPADPNDPAYVVYRDVFHPYQREAVDWLVSPFRETGLIALSPGLGKTIVALVAARLQAFERVLVVAPKPLLRSWENEALKFFGESWLTRRHGRGPDSPDLEAQWVLTNYDTVVDKVVVDKHGKVTELGPRLKQYMAVPWDLIILDESVLVKNRDSHRFKGMLALRQAYPKLDKCWWELSGYPVTRYADDLWAQLFLQDPKGFRSYWRFTNRVCYVEQDVWGTKVTGTRQNVDIIGDLADVMFVRNQKDVLSQLPEEIHELIEVELLPKQLKAYEEMENNFITTLEDGREVKTTIVISQMLRLQEITGNLANIGGVDESAKADAIVDLYEASGFDTPALIWTQWLPGAAALYKRLTKVSKDRRIEWIHGATSKREEADNEEKFEAYKRGDIDILILAMPVGKMGHNLQNTRTVIYHDKTWNGDDYVQSMKRVKRMGLEHRPVVFTIKAIGTVDQLVEDNLSGKFVGISKVANDDLAAMLRHLRGGR